MLCPLLFENTENVQLFLKRYHNQVWIKDDDYLIERCRIRECTESFLQSQMEDAASYPPLQQRCYESPSQFVSNAERKVEGIEDIISLEDAAFLRHLLKRTPILPELRPPSGLPQGNVGTPLRVIESAISACRLPTRIIKNLGLRFEHRRHKR